MPINIAIDGPGGAGKSSISDLVAEKLNILHLDTGAMYRAIGLFALQRGIDPLDEAAISRECAQAQVSVRYENGKQVTLLNGQDVTGLIRTQEVSQSTSCVSKWPAVRKRMIALQRELAQRSDMLIDGRDIGSNVLLDANLKIYLTASSEIRARRRYDELVAKGENWTYEEVLEQVNARDAQDLSRDVDPLVRAEDAIELDTSDMSIDQVVEKIVKLARQLEG